MQNFIQKYEFYIYFKKGTKSEDGKFCRDKKLKENFKETKTKVSIFIKIKNIFNPKKQYISKTLLFEIFLRIILRPRIN